MTEKPKPLHEMSQRELDEYITAQEAEDVSTRTAPEERDIVTFEGFSSHGVRPRTYPEG